MRSLVVFGLTAAACAGEPVDSDPPTPLHENPVEPDAPPVPDAPSDGDPDGLRVFGSFLNPDCDRTLLAFEAVVRRPDGTSVANPTCRITFENGVTSDACSGELLFPDIGEPRVYNFRLEATDPETGATGVEDSATVVLAPLVAELTTAPAACGLGIDFGVSVRPSGFRIVTISPEDKVVGDNVFFGSGSVQVTEPGTYTVHLHAEKERSGPICTKRITHTVDVAACPPCPPHEPAPPGDDHD